MNLPPMPPMSTGMPPPDSPRKKAELIKKYLKEHSDLWVTFALPKPGDRVISEEGHLGTVQEGGIWYERGTIFHPYVLYDNGEKTARYNTRHFRVIEDPDTPLPPFTWS